MDDLLLIQFEKFAIVKQNRNLFMTICGIDLEVRRADGTPLREESGDTDAPVSHQQFTDSPHSPVFCTCKERMGSCLTINKHVLEEVTAQLKPSSYICSGGYKRIVVPITLKENVIGIIFTGENQKFRFKDNQCATIMEMLTEFTNYVVDNELTPLNVNLYSGGTVTRQRELLNRAVKYIRKHYHSNELSLKDVSDNNGISYHYLSRIFKKELKTTFAQFRNKVRMDAAAKLLMNRRLSVSQISYACGFDDPAYFSKVFKESFGISPANFRSKHAPNPANAIPSS